MKSKGRFYWALSSAVIICFTLSTFNHTVASSTPSGEKGAHHYGVTELKQGNRRYARTFANLDTGEPRTVRLIYFTPNDWPYRADVVQNMKDTIRTVQTFYAEQMEAHGYGRVTFMVESDARGEPIVHHVNGKHPFSHYDNTTGSRVFNELQEAYDFSANIYFIVLGTDALRGSDGRPVGGSGNTSGKNGGRALVPNEMPWRVVAHELGHAFGLGHDFRDGAYIMSYGSRAAIGPPFSQLSACAAEFLSMHTYFNADVPIEVGEPPTIEFVSPRRYPSGSMSVPVRIKLNDSEGLHQLLIYTSEGVRACRNLGREVDALIEFDYDGGFGLYGFTRITESAVHPIIVDAVDTEGNVSSNSLTFAEDSPRHIATLKGHTVSVFAVSFLSDTTTVVSLGEAKLGGVGGVAPSITLWDVARQSEIATFGHHKPGISMTLSADGTTLATGGRGKVELWDVATRTHIATLEGHTNWVHCVAFSRDGRTLASGSQDHTVKLWDVATQQDIATFPHSGLVSSVAFSPDETILASGSYDGTVKLWDVERQQYITTLEGHWAGVTSVAFSRDGILASGSHDQTVILWDVRTQQEIGTLVHKSNTISVSFSPDGEILASGTASGSVELWSVLARVRLADLPNLSSVSSVAFSPDGTTLAAGIESWVQPSVGAIELWDTANIDTTNLLPAPEVKRIPDDNLAASVRENLDLPEGTPVTTSTMQRLRTLWTNYLELPIADISGLEHAANLVTLDLYGQNGITDFSFLRELKNLEYLQLSGTTISDVSALVANAGLANGDYVDLNDTLLNYRSIYIHIPTLQERGVEVIFRSRVPHGVRIVSGDDQQGLPSAVLPNPFLVEVRDTRGIAFEGVPVTFTVTAGDGTLSVVNTTTDENGRAQSTLTLGPNAGTNTVSVSVAEIQAEQTFNAEGIRIPKRLEIISGNDQEGLPDAALDNPFVVEVRDQTGEPLPGAQVIFSVTAGGGTLSITNAVTDSNGRAESVLTLGPSQGINTVSVSVTGIAKKQSVSATAESLPIPEDVNKDDVVNILDLASVASAITDGAQDLSADVNGDGVVNVMDLVMVAGALENAAAPSSNPQAPTMLTATELRQWLAQAQTLALTDGTLQRGLLFLEQLLAALTPKRTALLANYPNPSNPETWIPYQLAEDANVSLSIYDANGNTVSRLKLGHRFAGNYADRGNAAYWDGRNESGEQVASGMYFYHLSAGRYSATRKMLIRK